MQFTEQSRRAICHAQIEAGESGAESVEPEHLLLAVLRDDHCEARTILREQGCSPGVVIEEVHAALDAKSASVESTVPGSSEQIGLSPSARTILNAAAEAARREGRHFVGPAHILTALIRHPTQILAPVWERYNVVAPRALPDLGVPPASHERDYIPVENLATVSVWEQYTDAAQQSVAYAQSEATRSGFNAIPPLFLLSGILQEQETVVTDALNRCGVERNTLRETLIDLLPVGPGFDAGESIHFDPDSIAVVDEARRVSATLGDRHVGTEHLLLGLLADRGAAGVMLRADGIATANFLDALRSVKRGKRVEADKRGNPLIGIIWWLLFVAAIFVVMYFARR